MDRRLGVAAWIATGLQTLLFLQSLVLVFLSVNDSSGGAGLPTAGAPILAVLVAGAVRAVRGVCGGRALLIAADLAMVLAGLAVLSQVGPEVTGDLVVPGALVITLGLLAAIATPLLPAGSVGTVDRATARLILPIGILVVDVASVAVIMTGQGLPIDLLPVLLVSVVLADAVALVAWWYGARWVIGIQALTTFGTWFVSQVVSPDRSETAGIQLLLTAAYLFLAAVAFVTGPRLIVPTDDAEARDEALPLPARLWLVVAAALYPLLLLPSLGFGISDFCRDCLPHTALDEALLGFQLISGLAIPLFALVAVATGLGGPMGRRTFGWILIATSAILMAAVISAHTGNRYFGWAGYTTGPVALVGAAGILAEWPALGSRTGWAASLAAAGVGLVWSWAWAAPVLFIGESPVAIGALPTAFALPIAIAWEGSRVRGRSGVSTAGTARPGLALDTAGPSA